MGKRGETLFEGGGSCENLVRLSLYDGHMKTIEYMWVNIWCTLEWIVGFCHRHAVTQLVMGQKKTLLWLAGMNYVKLRTHYKATEPPLRMRPIIGGIERGR